MSEVATDLKTAAEERYLNYALSVITARALPDVRDGLKPVQRRILFAMHEDLRLVPGARHRKSAAVVGEVLGKYHPHGDQAAYEAMVRMAQAFALRYPLVHGEGNFGSLDGDGAAAMRYTEARLAAIAESLLADLDQETVPFRRNYDATRDEPVVLPASLPQLLMNGSTGIAVGMATNIPPHNLSELVDALVAMIAKPSATTRDLLKHVKGPDFPTGGEILNTRAELHQVYESGQGAIRLRGQYTLETRARGKRQIVVTSIPYGVNKAGLVEAIAERIMARKLPQVVDVRDESTEDVRIVLELKPDASEELAMAYLYKHTDLATNFNVNLTALTPTANPLVGQPARLSLAELCRFFLDFRLQIVTRRLEFERRKLEERLHILDALAKVHASLDKALRIIRNAESRRDAAEKLGKAFSFDAVQVNAILDLRLYQLARLEIDKVRRERREKKRRLGEVADLLRNERKRWAIIRGELLEAKKQYGDPRRTGFSKGGEELAYDPDAYVVHEEATVVVTRDGWVKRVRELKDPVTTRLREGDALLQVLVGSTRDRLAVFSTGGGLYVLPVKDLPATTGYGEPLASLVRFSDGERVAAVFLVAGNGDGQESPTQGDLFAPPVTEGGSYLVATAGGFGFRCTPDLTETTRAGRKIARVSKGDEIVSVSPVLGREVVCAARRGKMIRFPLRDVPELSGPGKGVYLMRPGEAGDRIIGAVCPPARAKVIVAPEDGKDRRLSVSEIPAGKRAGKGLKVVKRGTIAALRVEA